MKDFDEKLRELIWYELGDGLSATDVDFAVESIKRLFAEEAEKSAPPLLPNAIADNT